MAANNFEDYSKSYCKQIESSEFKFDEKQEFKIQ